MKAGATPGTEGLAIIAGSGLGDLGGRLTGRFPVERCVPFEDIDGVGACTVPGHRGIVIVCRAGESAYGRIALVLGRRHVYEGEPEAIAALVSWLAGIGIGDIVVVSAAGGVTAALHPGELVVVYSIIDMQNRKRSRPPDRTAVIGPGLENRRFARPRLSRRLIRGLERSAGRVGVGLGRATMACATGPAYETAAEVRALQAMGANVVTMSAAPEVVYALECGMDVAVMAAVTNRGTGIDGGPLDHGHVLEVGGEMCGRLGEILVEFAANGPEQG